MTYMAVEDDFHEHPKTIALFGGPCPADAIALWTMAGAWSSKALTDGFVPEARVKTFPLKRKAASELVRVGLWIKVEGGYQFHEWTERNPTAESVKKKRQATAERVANHRQRRMGGDEETRAKGSGNAPRNAPGNAPRNALHRPPGNALRNAPCNASGNATSNGVGNAAGNAVSNGVGTVRGPQSPSPSSSNRGGRAVAQSARDAEPAATTPPSLRLVHDRDAQAEARVIASSEELARIAAGAYTRAIEAAGGIFQGAAEWRPAFVAVGQLAAECAARSGSDARSVLERWARRYVRERASRRPDWWREKATAWAAETAPSEASAEPFAPIPAPGSTEYQEEFWRRFEPQYEALFASLGRKPTEAEREELMDRVSGSQRAEYLRAIGVAR